MRGSSDVRDNDKVSSVDDAVKLWRLASLEEVAATLRVVGARFDKVDEDSKNGDRQEEKDKLV